MMHLTREGRAAHLGAVFFFVRERRAKIFGIGTKRTFRLECVRSDVGYSTRRINSSDAGPSLLCSHRFHRSFQPLAQIVGVHDGQEFELGTKPDE
jgi:hypothetical protein